MRASAAAWVLALLLACPASLVSVSAQDLSAVQQNYKGAFDGKVSTDLAHHGQPTQDARTHWFVLPFISCSLALRHACWWSTSSTHTCELHSLSSPLSVSFTPRLSVCLLTWVQSRGFAFVCGRGRQTGAGRHRAAVDIGQAAGHPRRLHGRQVRQGGKRQRRWRLVAQGARTIGFRRRTGGRTHTHTHTHTCISH